MAQLSLRVRPDLAQLRTVRMVVASACRLADVEEWLLDDVRLAVTEVCGRAIAAHADHGRDEPVRLHVRVDPGAITIEINDDEPSGPGDTRLAMRDDEVTTDADDDVPTLPESIALVGGIADQLEVRTGLGGTHVLMRWLLDPYAA